MELTLPDELASRVTQMAEKQGTTPEALVTRAIERMYEDHQRTQRVWMAVLHGAPVPPEEAAHAAIVRHRLREFLK